MTTTIAENANRDMFLDGSGNVAFYSAADAVGQLCKSRIEAQRGEMKYATNQGMPTGQTAFNQFNPLQFEAAARMIITGTSTDVTGVTSFSMYSNDNVLNYTAVIATIYGQTTITGIAST